MSDELDVLGVNEAFYDAFSRRDIEALDRLWAAEGPLACIHPGWDAIRGSAAVVASFLAILRRRSLTADHWSVLSTHRRTSTATSRS